MGWNDWLAYFLSPMPVSALELCFRIRNVQEFFFFALLLAQCFRTVIKKDISNATYKFRIDDVNVCKRF